jgi:hypothetical protein
MQAILAVRTTDGAGRPARARSTIVTSHDHGVIVRAGDHRHLDQSVGYELAIGNDRCGTAFLGETVGIGKRHHNDVEGIEALRSFRHAQL